VIAVDGTKVQANANRERTVDYRRIARKIVAEAKATDEPRMSSMARRAVMSSQNSCGPPRASSGVARGQAAAGGRA
jgi:hypothetical protein